MIKINFNNIHMTLLSKAFLDKLFPLPYDGELKTDSVYFVMDENGDDVTFDKYGNEIRICDFYFTEMYFEKLKKHINSEDIINKFLKSNAREDWLSLRDAFDSFEVKEEKEGLKNYWLSIDPLKKE